MSIGKQFKTALKRVVFGDTLLPVDFTIGLVEPQDEISVEVHGAGAPLDVTSRYSMACSEPFTVCLGLDLPRRRLALQFRQRSGQRRVMGEIGLQPSPVPAAPGDPDLGFFEAHSTALYCLSRPHQLAHRLLGAASDRRRIRHAGAGMSSVERGALAVNFIRPHPVLVVSALGESGGTMFPMNLTGELGDGRFGLALQSANQPARLVESARRIAVSTVPLEHAPFAYRLGANHFRDSIDWNSLPFATNPSSIWKIPVPAFALRVREMEIKQVYRTGRHTFFVARVVSDAHLTRGPALHTIHGHYQAFRIKEHISDRQSSLRADAAHKGRPLG